MHLFHTRKLPMDRKQLEHLSHHPLRLVRDIWQWEWHARRLGLNSWSWDASFARLSSPRASGAVAEAQNARTLPACGVLKLPSGPDSVHVRQFF